MAGKRSHSNTNGRAAVEKNTADVRPIDRRRRIRRKRDPAAGAVASVVELLRESFSILAPESERLAELFYARFFERCPQARPLFRNVDMAQQRGKLISALQVVVENLDRSDRLAAAIQELGMRHQLYGARREHYRAAAGSLIETMAELTGPKWDRRLESAWSEAFKMVADAMLEAYQSEEGRVMAATRESVLDSTIERGTGSLLDDLSVMRDIMEHLPVNVMIADADEQILFINRRAKDVLAALEGELARYLPGFRADEVVGGSIHRYHKDAEAIKTVLRDLKPGDVHSGAITPGHFIFEHETRVLVDKAGRRIGYVVQWQDVTEKREHEEQTARLQRAVDGAQTAMMTIDRDLVITYVNGQTQELMRANAHALRAIYPGFDPERLVGTCIDIFHKNPAHQRQILGDPGNLPHEADIQVGPLTFHIRVSAIQNLKGDYVGNTLEWSDVTELRAKEIEVARLQSAIDGATANLMLCDQDLRITYCNPAVLDLFRARRSELAKIFRGFDPDKLVGQCIDQFHKNPDHQRTILSNPHRMPYRAEIKVLDIEFEINATMIVDKVGNYMGNMVEWKDITEQKDAERQIEGLISAASAGDLGKRIDTSRYEEFMKSLGENVNTLLESVVRPIREGTRVVQALAQGDLTQTMEGDFDGEFAELRDSVNLSLENLLEMVGKIREAAHNIESASSEISQGNADLSQRTEEQASSLEETASSVEELTGTVKRNAENAREANLLASGAREAAQKGGEVVGKAVGAMGAINDSSKQINEIIGVIDEIAFQTNLLALNAAVEAARAGEQGRGFAVVAAEVRNLAQRSAGAAKEIKSLIKDSVERVEEGSHLVNESGKTLEEIVASVRKVSDIVAEIASASEEQASGIDQVNKAVMQLDEVTQQNAALVEQSAAASESMDEQAKGMNHLVGYFRTGDEDAASATRDVQADKASPPTAPRQKVSGTRRPQAASRVPKAPSRYDSSGDEEWTEF